MSMIFSCVGRMQEAEFFRVCAVFVTLAAVRYNSVRRSCLLCIGDAVWVGMFSIFITGLKLLYVFLI